MKKCPKCNFINKERNLFCDFCGSNLEQANQSPTMRTRQTVDSGRKLFETRPGFLRGLWRLLEGIFRLFLYLLLIIICASIIMGILIFLCRVNVPNAPTWEYMPGFVTKYWEQLDDWQMERCPDLMPDNPFSLSFPLFKQEAEAAVETGCGLGTITFSPTSAPVGASLEISLDGFSPRETVNACWFFPSTKLENCIDIEINDRGRAKTMYFSGDSYPKGIYSMEADSICGKVVQSFSLE